jgi:hypothetical protein
VTGMRRRRLASIRFTLFLSIAMVPACFSLPHVDPGNRVLDDFNEDADLTPTWSAFGPWVCAPFISRAREGSDGGQDAGRDGGQDGGSSGDAGQLANPDGGQPVHCDVGQGAGDNSADQALVSTFDVLAPSGSDTFGVEVTTTTANPGSVVDLTGFTQILFDAELYSTTVGQDVVPAGTLLEVELGCSRIAKNANVDQIANVRIEASSWPPNPFTLSLEVFSSPSVSATQACLGAVDSISFKVLLGRATAAAPIAGTLKLDNIAFK